MCSKCAAATCVVVLVALGSITVDVDVVSVGRAEALEVVGTGSEGPDEMVVMAALTWTRGGLVRARFASVVA